MSLANGKFACAAIGGFNRESWQAKTNALLAWAILANKGWTLQAFCGYWGNVGNESVYNPWRWQNENILSSTAPEIYYQSAHAYGLGQWDPAGKYITGGRDYDGYGPNFSDKPGSYYDGWAQLDFMNSDYGQWISVWGMSFDDYKHSTQDPRDLARIFFDSWERGTWNEGRKDDAAYWWNFITNGEPIGPDQPTPDPPPLPPGPSGGGSTKSKFIFYLKPYWKRGL